MRAELPSAFATVEPLDPIRKPIGARLTARLAALWRAWRHRRQVVQLLAFDDRALGDIGLNRSDVAGALALSAGQDPSLRLAHAVRERRDARRWARREYAMLSAMDRVESPPKDEVRIP
jgi:uncharacterized protein YjiS (DUF1127 family)